MRKILVILSILMFAGCSNDNQLTISNRAQAGIILNFRAKDYSVGPGSRIVISDIPNGTYSYATTYSVPAGLTGTADEAAAGELKFQLRETEILLIYSSVVTDTAYNLYVTQTSSEDNNFDPKSPTAP